MTDSVSASLPRRPWWRGDVPLSWRTDSSIVVGHGARSVVVTDVSREAVAWLVSLNGHATLDEALADAATRGLGRREPRRILRAVVLTGALDDAASSSIELRDAVPAIRDRLNEELAALRHRWGSPASARQAFSARRQATVAIRGDGPVAEAMAATLTASGVGSLVTADGLRPGSRRGRARSGALTCVVLCDSTGAQSASAPEALALDVAHLPVSAHGSIGSVGPLVIPGHTSCLRCRDLHRQDADPAWSRVAVQLSRPISVVAPAALVTAVTGWAALMILPLIDATEPHRDSAQHEWTFNLDGSPPEATLRSPHPLCGCRWWAA